MNLCETCGGERQSSRPGRFCSDRCRKASYASPCVDCGALTDGSNGRSRPTQRCSACSFAHRRKMGRKYVLDSIAEWADLFGVPPSACDWNQSLAKANRMWDRVRRYEQTGRPWPSVSSAQAAFGSWNAAIEAAGWEPRLTGKYGREGEDMALCAQTAALYREGYSSVQLGEMFGVSDQTIRYRLDKAGEPRRSLIEAAVLRRAREASERQAA